MFKPTYWCSHGVHRYLEELFHIADANKDGVLQKDEFVQMLELSGYHFSESMVESMFMMADLDGDGMIQPHEVLAGGLLHSLVI